MLYFLFLQTLYLLLYTIYLCFPVSADTIAIDSLLYPALYFSLEYRSTMNSCQVQVLLFFFICCSCLYDLPILLSCISNSHLIVFLDLYFFCPFIFWEKYLPAIILTSFLNVHLNQWQCLFLSPCFTEILAPKLLSRIYPSCLLVIHSG